MEKLSRSLAAFFAVAFTIACVAAEPTASDSAVVRRTFSISIVPADPVPSATSQPMTQESHLLPSATAQPMTQEPVGYSAPEFMPFTMPPTRRPLTLPPRHVVHSRTSTTRQPAPNGFMQAALPLLSGVQNVVEQAEKIVSPGTAEVQKKAEKVPHVSSGTVAHHCTNSDEDLWNSAVGQRNWEGHMSSCGKKCFADASCVTSCMQGVGWSSGCSGCFGALAVCTVSNCVAQCIDGRTASCVACLTTIGCDTDAFGTGSCTGLTRPTLAPAKTVVGPSAVANTNAAASTTGPPSVVAGNTNAGLTEETDEASTRLKLALQERSKIESLLASVKSKLGKHSTGPVQVQHRTNSTGFGGSPKRKSLPLPLKENMQKVSHESVESGPPESIEENVKKGHKGPVTKRTRKGSSVPVEKIVRNGSSVLLKDKLKKRTPEQNAKKGPPATSEGKPEKAASETYLEDVLQKLQEKAKRTTSEAASDAHRLFLSTSSKLESASGFQSNFLSLVCVAVAVTALMSLIARFVTIRFRTPTSGERIPEQEEIE